ncbi:MAG: TetR/AcrR family transcriptional regulator [Verrucomicrobiales bacterium]|nr:TetR/AcrR family transcriptional regulator [Verrucomicrobiales bacterium]
MNEPDTKQRILDAAVEMMLEQSFHSVGLNQILSSVKVPKGSFYHYFPSKEQFGVELLRHYADTSNDYRRKMLLNNEVEENPVQRLLTFFTSAVGRFQESGGKCPCLLQKLATEVANFSDSMREELATAFADAIIIFRQTLDEAVTKEFLPQGFDTASEAEFIMDHWAGAQQRALISRDAKPLRDTVEMFRERLLALS